MGLVAIIDDKQGPSVFQAERHAFEVMLPQLLQEHEGQFVAIRNGKIIDEDLNEIALARRLERTHRREFVLIRQVTLNNTREDHLESP